MRRLVGLAGVLVVATLAAGCGATRYAPHISPLGRFAPATTVPLFTVPIAAAAAPLLEASPVDAVGSLVPERNAPRVYLDWPEEQVIIRRVPPTLLSLSPSSGAVGASVVITGRDFGSAQENSVVRVNGVVATATAWSSTSATITIPTTTTGSVTMARGGLTSNSLTFTVSTSTLTCTAPDLASPTPAQVNARIATAADGDVICITGNPTWGGTFIKPSATKAVTLACKPGNTCNVATTHGAFGLPFGTSSTKLFRITGFNFIHTGGGFLFWSCDAGGCTGTWTNFRFDHNVTTVDSSGGVTLFIGENSAKQYVYGVADHDTWTSAISAAFINWIGTTDTAPPPPPLGTISNFFIEDGTFTVTNVTNLGEGCSDGWGGMAFVFRHNVSTNCRWITHGATHGGGPSNREWYRNTLAMNAAAGLGGYRIFHDQGSGTLIVGSNRFSTTSSKNATPAEFLDYRAYWFSSDGPGTAGYSLDSGLLPCDGTFASDGNRAPTTSNYGYPCFHQPGRDFFGGFKPIVSWDNAWSDTGAKIDMEFSDQGGTPPPSCIASSGGTCSYDTFHIKNDRDYFKAVSASAQTTASAPFDGTTGAGFGTLARRPLSCTTATEAGAGVMYFATDDGPQGTLYTCDSANHWAVYWTPFTYPHPLATTP